MARKIWDGAEQLYTDFPVTTNTAVVAPDELNRLFAASAGRGRKGRVGLYMQSRFPTKITANP